jgi:sodium/proline symporter
MAWGLGYFGMPHILLRFMGIEDENKLKVSRRIATIWVVISMFVAILIGIIGYSMSKAGAVEMFTNSSESETLIIKVAMLLSEKGILAIIMAGLILAGILACTMSTADSQLLAASSSVSKNLLVDCFGLKLSQKASMLAARATVFGIAIIGVIIAWNPNNSVFKIVSFAWAGFGAVFGPTMLASLFWKRSNRYGILSGMVVGGVMVFVWKYLIAPNCGDWGLGFLNVYELLPAFVVAVIVNVAVSLLTKAPETEITEEFEEVKKLCKA